MRLAAVAVLAVALPALVLSASCSLGLDEAKIGDGGTANLPGRTNGDASGEQTLDATVPSAVQACAADGDCVAPNACAKGKCDLARKACVFDVCRPAACSASACDPGTRTCGAPASYKFRATQFSLGAAMLGAVNASSAAAVYPWLFVLLGTGLAAFDVSNPTGSTPRQVPISGLGFIPVQILASGNRIFALGAQSGAGPSRVPLAYLDVPSDPFVTQMRATTVLATSDRPAEGITMYPSTGSNVLLVGPGGEPSFPSVIATPPLVEPLSLRTTRLAVAMGTEKLASSGSRLLMQSTVNGLGAFTLVDGAGTAAPQTGAPVTIPDGPVSGAPRLAATSADGAIFFAGNVHTGADQAAVTRATRGYFVVPGAAGAIATAGVDVETYDVPGPQVAVANATTIAGVAMLDGTTAMVATRARENAAQIAVQFVRSNPLGVVREADAVTPRRALLPFPVGTYVATAGSNGIGYVLANDVPGPPANATAYVFDPACAP